MGILSFNLLVFFDALTFITFKDDLLHYSRLVVSFFRANQYNLLGALLTIDLFNKFWIEKDFIKGCEGFLYVTHRKSKGQIYWPSDLVNDFWVLLIQKRYSDIIIMLLLFIIIVILKKEISACFSFVCAMIFFHAQYMFVYSQLHVIFKINTRLFVEISKYNSYHISVVRICIFVFFVFPKVIAFLIVYAVYGGSRKISYTDLVRVIYFRIIEFSFLFLKLANFAYAVIWHVITYTPWSRKNKLSWFFIFLYEARAQIPIQFNDDFSDFFKIVNQRKIHIKNGTIILNDMTKKLLWFWIHENHVKIRGLSLLAQYSGKNHPFVYNPQNIHVTGNKITDLYGGALTHSKKISAPWHTEKITMPTQELSTLQKQYYQISGTSADLLHVGNVRSYEMKYLNKDMKFLSELEIKAQMLKKAKTLRENSEALLLIQQPKAMQFKTLQEMKSDKSIGKEVIQSIEGDHLEDYLKLDEFLKKENGSLTSEEREELIDQAIQTFMSSSPKERANWLVEAFHIHGDVGDVDFQEMVNMVLYSKY